jgi:hypothetical protein
MPRIATLRASRTVIISLKAENLAGGATRAVSRIQFAWADRIRGGLEASGRCNVRGRREGRACQRGACQ